MICIFQTADVLGQKTDANIFGDVKSHGEHLPFATVHVRGTKHGVATDHTGHYMMIDLPEGDFEVTAEMVGFKKQTKKVTLVKGKTIELNFNLDEEVMSLNEVVVTGTKTFKRQTDSPVIVNVLDARALGLVQANTLSEGLGFQPGLRVETDCQTCNYTQLRMNGLGGSYSQILINSRPVFSPLTGLYGMEQIPSNMIDRIEVVRGGGSALYGSSAIGGTVNVLTKIPTQNSYEMGVTHSIINGAAHDNQVNANLNVLSPKRNAGMAFFASNRQRDYYDHNGDNFSEMPKLKNNSFGVTSFFKPTPNQKIEMNFSSIYEYRYGGEMVDKAAHMALQSEERTHNVFMGGLDYEIEFNDNLTTFIAYAGAQNTVRKHYTGTVPDEADSTEYNNHFMNPPYGDTDNTTFQGGVQLNHIVDNCLIGTNQFTVGLEYLYDDVFDEIKSYEYEIDQTTYTTGVFIQSDWALTRKFTLLSGLRLDKHNLMDKMILNPRFSTLYKLNSNTQVRASWATGFRAPQAFDTDMHIAFAGGGVSRIRLSEDLEAEKSNSFTASINYDLPTEKFIWGFTFEGFHTQLNKAFMLEEAGEDQHGLIFEKRNSNTAVVKGVTAELRANYNRLFQVETGFTLQSSYYKTPVKHATTLDSVKNFLKTPHDYGYYTISYTPTERWSASISGIYTGKMDVLHLVEDRNSTAEDKYENVRSFFENSFKVSYLVKFPRMNNGMELFGGIKNVFNQFQSDFDKGKNRHSDYIYGPATPRMIYFGLKIKSI